jgi:hypothetical protein
MQEGHKYCYYLWRQMVCAEYLKKCTKHKNCASVL